MARCRFEEVVFKSFPIQTNTEPTGADFTAAVSDSWLIYKEKRMGLVKTRRLAAMQKQQRAKAGMKPPKKGGAGKGAPRQFATAPKTPLKAF